MPIKDHYNTLEAARELGVTDSRVRQLIAAGIIKGTRINGKAWLVHRREIERRLRDMAARSR